MAQREYANFVTLYVEAIERDVAGGSVRDDELAEISFDSATDERMIRKILDGRSDGKRRRQGGIGIVGSHEFERVLEIDERACRIDYLRHGFGRGLATPWASRSTQACTSSAR